MNKVHAYTSKDMKNEIVITLNGEKIYVPYSVIKSSRKTLSIEVKAGGDVVVKVPRGAKAKQIDEFIDSKKEWIINAYFQQKDKIDIKKARQEERNDPRLAYLEKKYRAAAKKYIYERVEYYLPMTGGAYSSIRIADQSTRWGSCSSNGTLSFSWRLMLAPMRVLDYVVIHELCHLTYMNHSAQFWAKVESIDPDYREHRRWLKENGDSLILK